MTRRRNLSLSFLMERNYEWQHSNGLGLGLGLGLAICLLEWYKRVTRRHFVQRPSMEPTVAKRIDESHSQHAKNKFNDSNRIFFLAELLFSDIFSLHFRFFFFINIFLLSLLSCIIVAPSFVLFFFSSVTVFLWTGRRTKQNLQANWSHPIEVGEGNPVRNRISSRPNHMPLSAYPLTSHTP